MAAKMTRLTVRVSLRWRSGMCKEPRSCFGEFVGVAIVAGVTCSYVSTMGPVEAISSPVDAGSWARP
jgi:hypothetical protein